MNRAFLLPVSVVALLSISQPAFAAGPAEIDFMANIPVSCQNLPNDDNANHLYISDRLATAIGIKPSSFVDGVDKWQVRVTLEPKQNAPMGAVTSTAVYTVTQVCGGWPQQAWFGDLSDLFIVGGANNVSQNYEMFVEGMAPGSSFFDNVETVNFVEPIANKPLTEFVESHTDRRVALLIPHGGNIEVNTSDQVDDFVDTLSNAGHGVNVWDVQGIFGSSQTDDRYHITSTDIRPDGYPALRDLLDPFKFPQFDPLTDRYFEYAVAFHGFSDSSDYGIILGGAADPDIRCYVAAQIESEAVLAGRGGEIGFNIADAAANNSDLIVQNNNGYDPAPWNLNSLQGVSDENIVNWISAGVQGGNIVANGGIQLEQSKCVRQEDSPGKCAQGQVACGNNCMRHIVARGVANALADIFANPAVSAGACAAL